MKEKKIKLNTLKLNDRNPRTIKSGAFKRLYESIKRDPDFMTLRPIIVDEANMILGGNQRCRACQHLGMMEVPESWVKVAKGLTLEQRKRFIVMDNAPEGMAGEWDIEILAADWELPELKDMGFDKLLAELQAAQTPDGKADAEPQMDQAEELNKKWCVNTGDLWLIGEHRLMCGDSTKKEDVGRVMGGERAVLCISDPPYNYDYQYAASDDNLDEEAFIKFTNTWFFIARQFAAVRVITPGLKNLSMFLRNYGATWICAWVKKNAMTASKIGHLSVWEPIVFDADDYDWEPVIVYGKPKKKVKRDVYEYPIKVQKDTSNHPCPKLIEFWVKLVGDFSKPKDSVIDVFLGSGTTMVACQNLNRKCRGIEISPDYCAVILERMATAFPGIDIQRVK